eukprot:6841548-Prymnesium_polylepis.1
MMRAAEQCHADTPHAGRRPCVLPHGAQGDMRAAAGEAEWDVMLRASVGATWSGARRRSRARRSGTSMLRA